MMAFLKDFKDGTSDHDITAEVLTEQMNDKGCRKKKREIRDQG
jgi:hypothetical protein